jgi:hypothetical protein
MTSSADRSKAPARKSALVAAAAAALAAPVALAPPAEAAIRPHAVASPHTTGSGFHNGKTAYAKSISTRGGAPARSGGMHNAIESISWGHRNGSGKSIGRPGATPEKSVGGRRPR